MNEADIVRLLTRDHADPRALGFDDDVCVIDGDIVTSTDMLVEDVDFRLRTFSAGDVAHKALAVNLSDLAAAGAVPVGFTLALALPEARVEAKWIDELATALRALAAVEGCALLGGDLSRTDGPIVIALSVFGKADRVLRRRVGSVGDRLCVSGELGAAAAGLAILERGVVGDEWARLRGKQRRPSPRVAHGRALAANEACLGAIDLSDGLAADLPRLLPEGLGAALDLSALPIAADTRRAAEMLGVDPVSLATSGGEDFELLCVLRAGAPVPAGFTAIGEIVRGAGTPLAAGFDHFVTPG